MGGWGAPGGGGWALPPPRSPLVRCWGPGPPRSLPGRGGHTARLAAGRACGSRRSGCALPVLLRGTGLPARAPGGGGRWLEVTPACLLLPGLQPPQTRPWPARGPASDPALSSADCVLGDTQSGEQPRRSCTVYRPWFSPYSYFVCTDVDSRLEAHGFPEAPWAGGRGDGGLPEDAAESICSSSSPEDTCPREAAPEPRPGPDAADRITPQDVLMASRWQPAQQSGYKCVACCRMYPSLRSLQSHIRGGFKEGFSCRVYYRRLKALWGREQWARPGDRLSSSASCQASP